MFAWVDSAFLILDEWSSYRGGYLNRFACIPNIIPGIFGNLVVKSKLPPRSGSSLEAVESNP